MILSDYIAALPVPPTVLQVAPRLIVLNIICGIASYTQLSKEVTNYKSSLRGKTAKFGDPPIIELLHMIEPYCLILLILRKDTFRSKVVVRRADRGDGIAAAARETLAKTRLAIPVQCLAQLVFLVVLALPTDFREARHYCGRVTSTLHVIQLDSTHDRRTACYAPEYPCKTSCTPVQRHQR